MNSLKKICIEVFSRVIEDKTMKKTNKNEKQNAFLPHFFQVLFFFTLFATQMQSSSARTLKKENQLARFKTNKQTNNYKIEAFNPLLSNTSTNKDLQSLTAGKKRTSKKKNRHLRKTRHIRSSSLASRFSESARTKMIKTAILTLPELYELLAPIKWHGSLDGMIGPSDYGHLQGTVRLKRLYCRVGIGYHLEINKKGKVSASHLPTADGIMEIFSVKRKVVGIRSVAHRDRYLCMNRAGKVFTRKRFQPSCEFRENLEGNRYNTYASERFSDHEKREGYFLAVNKNGKLPKRMKRVSWKQKRAHWLPRSV